MALVDTTLQTAIMSIFTSMGSMTSGGDRYLAKNLALAIKNFVLTASVATTDTGTVTTTSAYAGSGTGLPGCFVIDNSSLETSLYNTFTKENVTNEDIANGIANAINSACSKSNIISTTTLGVLTPPPPATPISPYSGTGQGTFTGNKSIISQKFLGQPGVKGTFEKMQNMTSGGDTLFAADFASAVGSYLRGGVVNVTLNAPITGSGAGSVS